MIIPQEPSTKDRDFSCLPYEFVEPLTPRQREVLELIACGKGNAEIAEHLFISRLTVQNHVSEILSRLHAPNRTAAAVYAVCIGLIKVNASSLLINDM